MPRLPLQQGSDLTVSSGVYQNYLRHNFHWTRCRAGMGAPAYSIWLVFRLSTQPLSQRSPSLISNNWPVLLATMHQAACTVPRARYSSVQECRGRRTPMPMGSMRYSVRRSEVVRLNLSMVRRFQERARAALFRSEPTLDHIGTH